MKTINKLRGFLSESPSAVYPDEVLEYVDAIERELEEEYVALPKDVNGDVWRVNDLIVGELNPNNPKRVERMLWYGPDAEWQLETDRIIYTCPERSRHYHTPTVEDVLREFVFEACGDSTPEEAVVKRFAERLQLKERHDG